MELKNIIFWILIICIVLSLISNWRNPRPYQYGGMDPGVYDQMASNSGPEDAYLMTSY